MQEVTQNIYYNIHILKIFDKFEMNKKSTT